MGLAWDDPRADATAFTGEARTRRADVVETRGPAMLLRSEKSASEQRKAIDSDHSERKKSGFNQ